MKISDDGFIKYLKDHFQSPSVNILDFPDDFKSHVFGEDGDDSKIRLAELKAILLEEKTYKLSNDEIERICEIANEKCQSDIPGDDPTATWIDVEKFT